MHIDLTILDRHVEFDMGYDQSFPADVATRYHLEQHGVCEPEVACLMARVLREGDVAFDVGANIGFFTLLMSRLVGPTGKVVAFEPGLNNLAKLQDNIRLSEARNVRIVPFPLWSRAEMVTLYMNADSGRHSLANDPTMLGSVQAQAATLERYCLQHDPKLIKIDAEGAEVDILRGYCGTPASLPYVICEANNEALDRFGTNVPEMRSLMEAKGYDTFALRADGSLPAMVPPKSEVASDVLNANVLFSTLEDVGRAWPVVRV